MRFRPMVGRSVQVNSLCFTKADWQQNLANGAKANLLVFTPGAKENGNEGTKAYIENGEQLGINKGYKKKNDNVERYLDQSAKIYYTGKKFPSTVALNKLYYFMPYIKRKGIRDLYLIKIARVGTRKEGQPDNDPNDFRLVFEIEFVKKLFKDYKPVELEIWHTFTDTTTEELLERFVLK